MLGMRPVEKLAQDIVAQYLEGPRVLQDILGEYFRSLVKNACDMWSNRKPSEVSRSGLIWTMS
jgi:hypothetical protein